MDPASLAQVEALCDIFYTKLNTPEWANANQQILQLQSSAEYIPQCQYILDHSNNAYALHLASSALTKLVTTHWNNFTVQQHIDIRNYVLGYLAGKGPTLVDFVSKSLIQLVCRLTKLGWFDDAQHREITTEVNKFLTASVDHCVIGLRILNHLVEELNIPVSGRTLTQHRKTAVSFRDQSLLDIFSVSINLLQQLNARAVQGTAKQQTSMGEQALALVVRCLSYDFIGTNPDDSSDDVSTIQVPSSWRGVCQDHGTLGMLLEFYGTTEPPRSSSAMQAVILLSSVRRSLFHSDKDRSVFLGHIMVAVRDILSTQQGLNFRDNYHEFCRLLGRLKSNYQLSELVRTEVFIEWLELAAAFSVRSFEQWQWSTNSIHYLLQLWGRLVAAVPYVHAEQTGTQLHMRQLEQCTVRVLQAYIKAMLDSAQHVVAFADECLEDPLDNDGALREQLDRLPLIFRFQYPLMCQYLISQFDPCMAVYHELLTASATGASADLQQRIQVVEGQLTWLMYIIGAVIGGLSWNTAPSHEGEEGLDASLARCGFQLAQGIDYRLVGSNGQAKSNPRLEVAILFFFQNLRKIYLVDPAMSAISSLHSSVLMGAGSTPYDVTHRASHKQKATAEMFERMGMGDQSVIVSILVSKVVNNLKYWGEADTVLKVSLDLLLEMTSVSSAESTLLAVDSVQFLVQNHTPEHFPFLLHPKNFKFRTTLNATLARLVFFQNIDDLPASFAGFMEPIQLTLMQLNAMPNQQLRASAEARQAMIGVCRDLRGVTRATTNKRTYNLLFESLYPTYFPIFTRAAEVWYDDPDVVTSLFKFMEEFVNNKGQRVNFDNSSPNGILLFRETSAIVTAYGTRHLEHHRQQHQQREAEQQQGQAQAHPHIQSVPGDPYRERYKGISLALLTLTVALSGSYVNFGVFALYNDKALENALEVALHLALSVSLEDILAYRKLARNYFAFLDALFRNHLAHLAAKDTATFMTVMAVLHEGLQALEPPMSTHCASAMDHFASYLYNNRNRDWASVHMLKAHVQMDPTLITRLTATLFTQLLFGPYSNHWAVTKPILSLMMADEASFNTYREHLMASQAPENQVKLQEAFEKLLTDISRNLEPTNRERFQQHLASFRQNVRGFLTL